MKFYDYINEKEDDLIEKIKNDCSTFLKEAKGSNHFLLRRSKIILSKYEIKSTRRNREPIGVPEYFHNKLDEYMKEKFGWKARGDGLFCGSSKKKRSTSLEKLPSKGGLVFPIGNFDFVGNPEIKDFYNYLHRVISDFVGTTFGGELEEKEMKEVGEGIIKDEAFQKYTNKDLKGLLNSFNEISIKMNKYYFVVVNHLSNKEIKKFHNLMKGKK